MSKSALDFGVLSYGAFVGLQPTVIASRAPHLLLEQSVMKNRGRASPVNGAFSGLVSPNQVLTHAARGAREGLWLE